MTPRKRKLIQPTFAFPMVSVAVLLSAFLVYYFPVTARQEASLNRRAFRSLAAVSDSLRSRVVTYASVLEQAEKKGDYESAVGALATQAADFALEKPDGQVPCVAGKTTVSTRSANGTYHLELRCGSWWATGHIDQMLAPHLRGTPDQIFDDVLLADAEGLVLYQSLRTGNRISDLRTASLGPAAQTAATQSPPASGSPANSSFAKSSQTSSLFSIVLAGEPYKLYLVPVPLTLASTTPAGSQLVLAGLMRDSRFRSDSRAVPGTALMSLILLLLVIVVATWPLLKFTAMRATERVPRRSAVYFYMSTLATIILVCILAIHFRYIYDLRGVDANLRSLARAMERNLEGELRQALQVMDAAEHSQLFREDMADHTGSPTCGPNELSTKDEIRNSRAKLLTLKGLRLSDYPYFERIFWADNQGNQHVKWDVASQSTSATYVGDRPYFVETMGNRLWQFADQTDSTRRFRLDSVFSRNTGEYRAVVSRRAQRAALCGEVELSVLSLVTPLLSLIDPIMPPDYGFAMVDESGEVLFHSTSAKNRQERLIDEVDDPSDLRVALFARQGKFLTARYLGFEHRLFVTPLVRIRESPWSLIVFHNLSEGAAQHLERIVVFSWLTLAYFLVLAVILVCVPHAGRPPTWIWPRSHMRDSYLHLALGLALIGVLFYLLIFEMSSIVAILATAFIIPLLVVAAGILKLKGMDGAIRWMAMSTPFFWLVVSRLEGRSTVYLFLLFAGVAAALVFVTITIPSVSRVLRGVWDPTLATSFAVLWTTGLMLLGLLPCVAFFKVAYDYHENLSTRRLQIETIVALAAREERVKAQYGGRELTPYPRNSERAEVARWLFLRRRLEQSLDRYDTEFLSSKPGQVYSSNTTRGAQTGGCEDGLPPYLARLAYMPYGGGTLARTLSEPSSTNSMWSWCRDGSNRIKLTRRDDVARIDADAAGLAPSRALLKSVTGDPTFLRFELVSELPVLKRWPWLWPIVAVVLASVITFFWVKPTLQQMFLLKIKRESPLPELALDESTVLDRSLILLGLDTTPVTETLMKRKDVCLIDFANVMRGTEPEYDKITHAVVAIEHFDYRNDSDEANRKKLDILERLHSLYPSKPILIVTTIDPSFYFGAGADFGSKPSLEALVPGQDLDRWARAMARFETVRLPHPGACSTIEHGRMVWSTCTTTERVALYQLAHDGWVNPRNEAALHQLQRRGLIRDMPFQFADAGLRAFVRGSVSAEDRKAWEQQDAVSIWDGIRMMFVVLVLGGAAAALFFNQQSVLGLIVTGAGVLTPVTKLLTEAQSFRSLLGFKTEK